MKTFKRFMREDSNPSDSHDYHHTSRNAIDTDAHNSGKGSNPDHPMWLSHNKDQASGWHKHTKDNEGSAHTYKVKVSGKIAHHKDPKVKALFKKHGHDMNDYHDHLVGNPSHKGVHDHPATKMLQKAGYHGHTHPDYDPHDFSKDHDSTVVFHRKHAKMEKSSVGKQKSGGSGDSHKSNNDKFEFYPVIRRDM